MLEWAVLSTKQKKAFSGRIFFQTDGEVGLVEQCSAVALGTEQLAQRMVYLVQVEEQLTNLELWLTELWVYLAKGDDHLVKGAAEVVPGKVGA